MPVMVITKGGSKAPCQLNSRVKSTEFFALLIPMIAAVSRFLSQYTTVADILFIVLPVITGEFVQNMVSDIHQQREHCTS